MSEYGDENEDMEDDGGGVFGGGGYGPGGFAKDLDRTGGEGGTSRERLDMKIPVARIASAILPILTLAPHDDSLTTSTQW